MIILALLSVSFTTRVLAFGLDDLVEIGSDIVKANKKISTKEEVELGGNLVSGLLGAAPLVDNSKLQRYVNDVGYWVASHSSRANLPWRFGVIDSPGINAFAAPGGYIVMTLGLFSLLSLFQGSHHVFAKHEVCLLAEPCYRFRYCTGFNFPHKHPLPN